MSTLVRSGEAPGRPDATPGSHPARPPAAPKLPRGMGYTATLGLGAIALAVGGFGVWASTAPLASAVVAQGKVVVATKRKEIQHLDGGIVKTIHVADGDAVAEGDPLFELDPTKARARYLLSRAAYFSGLSQQARLSAERDGGNSMTFPDELIHEARSDSEVALAMAAQQQLFHLRLAEHAGQISIWRKRVEALMQGLEGQHAERRSVVRQLELAMNELRVVEDLYKRGYTTRQRVHNIRRETAQLEGSRERIETAVVKARKEINEAELSVAQLEKKRKTDAVTELRQVEEKIFEHKETYIAAEAELERMLIKAPVRGTVVGLQVHTIGGVVKPGETLVSIVPSSDNLVVEARIRPLDIDNVERGQETEVRFSGFKQRLTPTVRGSLVHVAADAMTDERTNEPYYLASVSVSESELARLGPANRVQPGMPAELLIKSGERTAFAYLLEPIFDSVNRAWREE